MLVFNYESKKALKECIGKPLRYIETSMFGPEYRDKGILTGANRPQGSPNLGIRRGDRRQEIRTQAGCIAG